MFLIPVMMLLQLGFQGNVTGNAIYHFYDDLYQMW